MLPNGVVFTEAGPKDYERAVVVDAEGSKKTNKTTLRSEW